MPEVRPDVMVPLAPDAGPRPLPVAVRLQPLLDSLLCLGGIFNQRLKHLWDTSSPSVFHSPRTTSSPRRFRA